MINQSRLLSKFYKDLSEWITRGCPEEEEVFDTDYGLCDNFNAWLCEQRRINPEISIDRYYLQSELKHQLRAEFGYTRYPFNCGESDLYEDEKNKYTNQERIDWIAAHTPSEY